ncbi:glucosyltransferase domain-containing protein [Candidatus Saccharibacteria bacterium]|nr:glucosyltransferase domain-containing protein [Candidatus Saccharibacteria bacterium]
MNKISAFLNAEITNKKKLLLNVAICTFALGLLAHALGFMNIMPSHDYLNEFYAGDSFLWKVQLGRFVAPLVGIVLGQFVVSPWLSGIVSILLISVAAYFTIKIFSLKKRWEIFLLSGIFVTNATVICLISSFTHDLVVNSLALVFSVLAVYEWSQILTKFNVKRFLGGIVFVLFTLGLYQSYLSVTLVMISFLVIEMLLKKQKLKPILKNALIGILMIGIAGLGYLGISRAACGIAGTDLKSGSYNSLTNAFEAPKSKKQRLFSTYGYVGWVLFSPTNSWEMVKSHLDEPTLYNSTLYAKSLINIIIAVISLGLLIKLMIDSKVGVVNKLLVVVIIALLPLMANISHFLSGMSHTLMCYAMWLYYLAFILLIRNSQLSKRLSKLIPSLAIGMMAILILFNIEHANTAYVKKDLLAKSTLSTMTRVLSRIEEQDGYEEGKTPVLFIQKSKGISAQKGTSGTESVDYLVGLDYNSSISYKHTIKAYFSNVLQYNLLFQDDKEVIKRIYENEALKDMHAFPDKSCIQTIDGTIVVVL